MGWSMYDDGKITALSLSNIATMMQQCYSGPQSLTDVLSDKYSSIYNLPQK